MNYKVKKELYFNRYIGFYFAYAVICRKEGIKIPDAFSEKAKAMEFVALINELSLDPIHLYDVLEDFIS